MGHYLELDAERAQRDPVILIVPGLESSGPQWHSLWYAQCSDCRRLDLGEQEFPFRNNWVNRLNLAIHQAGRPVMLVAHGLGCLAVAWWAEYERPTFGNPVVGALLVAPPDVDRPGADPRFARFAPAPRLPLPFPSFVAASQDDPFCSLGEAQALASEWGSRFAFAGAIGHIDSESELGDWLLGKRLLAQLLHEHRLETGRDRRHERAKALPRTRARRVPVRTMEQAIRYL